MRDHAPVDVLVIGAGPTGAVTAQRLAQAGMSVVCLEQGTWPDYDTASATGLGGELVAGRGWNFNPNVRARPEDYPINDASSDIAAQMWNGVGGSSLLFAAQWTRNLPSDFRVRTLDGVGDDWPLTYDELVPYYERVEQAFAVSGLSGDPAYPAGHSVALPPAPLRAGGRRIAQAHNELGWHWWPGSNTIATRAHGRMGACLQRGVCMWGCPERAKASADVSHWPDNLELGVDLRTGARVRSIEVDARDRATGAIYVDEHGNERFQAASVVVLAANGIGTPRILLNSATKRWSDGLANRSGLVGRRLMMHPFAAVLGLFDDELDMTQGVWGNLVTSLQFYETDESRGFVRGAKWGLVPTGGPLSIAQPYPWGDEPIWGERFHDIAHERLGRSMGWGIIAEDLPNEANRVVLDPELYDADGVPAPRIVYETSENSRRMLAFNVERAKESLLAAGARSVTVAPQIRESGWHMLGTTKMGEDPADSVVDRWGRTHDVPNLYVFDGSVMPTSAGLNPTATVAAFALRGAEHLVQTRDRQAVAA